MSYTINNTPLAHWGVQAGTVGTPLTGYALSGVWSLPKRRGQTHCVWPTEGVEPYVASGDIVLDGRDLTWSLACKASTRGELAAKIEAFLAEVPDHFTLAHPILGTYHVGLQEAVPTVRGRVWAQLTLKLREPQPVLGTVLPQTDGGAYGIDGRSWARLGLVVSKSDGVHDLPAWKPLAVTLDPQRDTWAKGYRTARTLTIAATIKGDTYADFAAKVAGLQALLSAPGVRSVALSDGTVCEAFCVDGFEVDPVYNFRPVHWGTFTCKMTIV